MKLSSLFSRETWIPN